MMDDKDQFHIPAITLEDELLRLEKYEPDLRAMLVANAETHGPFSGGATFWIEQHKTVIQRIAKIKQLLAMDFPHVYAFSGNIGGCMYAIRVRISAWPTRSFELANQSPSYFYVPNGLTECPNGEFSRLWQQSENPESHGFFHIGGFEE